MLHLTRIYAQQQQQFSGAGLDGDGAGGGLMATMDADRDDEVGRQPARPTDRGEGHGGGSLSTRLHTNVHTHNLQTQAEVLLESFLQDCSELIAKWELVKEDMGNTENFCLMQLDLARNRLLTIGTIFALVNLCFAFGAMIAGVFGMNLYNGAAKNESLSFSFSLPLSLCLGCERRSIESSQQQFVGH